MSVIIEIVYLFCASCQIINLSSYCSKSSHLKDTDYNGHNFIGLVWVGDVWVPCWSAAQHECSRQIFSASLKFGDFLLAFKIAFYLFFFFLLNALCQSSLSVSLNGCYHTNKHLGHLRHTIHILCNTHIFWSIEHCNSFLFLCQQRST